jgi:hypothetical protein
MADNRKTPPPNPTKRLLQCSACGQATKMAQERVISGGRIGIEWTCSHCGAAWRATPGKASA